MDEQTRRQIVEEPFQKDASFFAFAVMPHKEGKEEEKDINLEALFDSLASHPKFSVLSVDEMLDWVRLCKPKIKQKIGTHKFCRKCH